MNTTATSQTVRVGSAITIDGQALIVIRITKGFVDVARVLQVERYGLGDAWLHGFISYRAASLRQLFASGRVQL